MIGSLSRAAVAAALVIAAFGAFVVAGASGDSDVTFRIRVSVNPDRSASRPLSGQTVGLIYVFVGDDATIRRVRYYLDDPGMSGRPRAVRSRAPFDLVGRTSSGDARAFDTRRLSDGKHTLTAAIELEAGSTRVLQSSFRVPRLFVSPTGSYASACTRIIPCQGFARAYDLARAGQVVEVAPGDYPAQRIVGTKEAPGVLFDLQGGHLAGVELYATNVEFRNGRIDSWYWNQSGPMPPANVTFRNIAARSFYMNGGSNISMYGGELGPNGCGPSGNANLNWIYSEGATPIQNVLLDGVRIHDNKSCYEGEHVEAIRIDRNAAGITIRNSQFTQNEIFHIFITDSGFSEATVPHDIMIENNTFDRPLFGAFAVKTQEPSVQTCRNYTIRGNRFGNAGAIGLFCPTKVNVVIRSNTVG